MTNEDVAILRLDGGKANAMSSERIGAIARLVDRGPAARMESSSVPRRAEVAFRRRRGALVAQRRCERRAERADVPRAAAKRRARRRAPAPRNATSTRPRIGLNETQLGIGLASSVLAPLKLAVPAASLVPIAYEGRLFAPAEAHALGLVHELSPAGELEARATERARALAAVPSTAVAQVKLGLRRAALEAMARVAADETEAWLDTWFSPPARTRLHAAVAKLRR